MSLVDLLPKRVRRVLDWFYVRIMRPKPPAPEPKVPTDFDDPDVRARRKKLKFARIKPLLVCPSCRGRLEERQGSFRCPACGLSYPIGENSVDFLTADFKKQYGIVSTDNVSSWGYDEKILEIVEANPEKMYLDCGAGSRNKFHENVINYEIVDYPSTDILGVAEQLPFADESLDGVFSVAVLEHVKDPFCCAREIMRVLKPGGVVFAAVPFLQPVHAYPHHYYNMTTQGLANLFNGLEIKEEFVPLSLHPMTTIQWMMASYRQGLPEAAQHEFSRMRVKDLLELPPVDDWYRKGVPPIVAALAKEKWAEIAGGNCLLARKPDKPSPSAD